VTSLSESSQGEVGDNREKWGDFWEKFSDIANKYLDSFIYKICIISIIEFIFIVQFALNTIYI
jgi:hypothetical protein